MKNTKAIKRKTVKKTKVVTVKVEAKRYIVGSILSRTSSVGKVEYTLRMRDMMATSEVAARGVDLQNALDENPGCSISCMKCMQIINENLKADAP